MRTLLGLVLMVIVLLAACTADAPGGDSPVSHRAGHSSNPGHTPADGTLTITGGAVDPPALQVADALAAEGPVLVAGALFVAADGSVLLCSAIAESFPPQCGGERLEVIGLDLAALDLEEANGVRWAESVELAGVVG